VNSSSAKMGVTSLKWFLAASESSLPGGLSSFRADVIKTSERNPDDIVRKVRSLSSDQLTLICRMIGTSDREYFGSYRGSELRKFLREICESDSADAVCSQGNVKLDSI
jgi:hypothetical protein